MAKKSTRASLLEAQRRNAELFARVGYTGKLSGQHVNAIPDYSTRASVPTSDSIGNGYARAKDSYTGSEIAGVVLNHKSNYEPVRRDNKQAAVEAAAMRR
jgi:hypothetical protein